MKFLTIVLLSFFSYINCSAEKLVEVMRIVNVEIDNQNDIPDNWKTEEMHIANFNEAIQTHLLHVVYVLRNRNVTQLNASQRLKRTNLLNILNSYALDGVFPINNHANYKTPVFIDKAQTHCAVGFLMKESGFGQLAQTISAEQNLAYVKDIKVDGVVKWAEDHGFTLGELAWIQPGYPPATTITPLLGGMDGDVYSIVEYQSNIYAAGDFGNADGNAAENIAVYIAGFAGYLWTDVQGGTNGPVHKLFIYENDLVAGGDISHAGNIDAYGVARMHDGVWEPMGEGLDGIVYDFCIWNNSLYAFGDFDIIGSDTDGRNVAIWNGSSWDDAGLTTNGPVYSAHSGTSLILGGDFSMVGNFSARNIAIWNGSSISAAGDGPEMPVYDVLEWNSKLIAGGALIHNNIVQGLLRFDAGTWNSFSDIDNIASNDSAGSIHSLLLINNELIVGGNYSIYPMVGVFGDGLAKWTEYNQAPEPLAWLDSTVYTCEDIGGLYIGGAFRNSYGNTLNGIARVDNITTIQFSNENKLNLNAYPIPANGSIKLVNTNKAKSLQLFDISGRHIQTFGIQEGSIIPIPSSGIFILRTDTGESIRIVNNN